MLSLEKFSLKDNPFGIAPVPELRLWANRKVFKSEVENVIKSALISTPSRIVACFYGDWGMGKTHTATYFSHEETLRELAAGIRLSKMPLSIYLIFPPRDVFDSLYLEILDRIGIAKLRTAADSALKDMEILDSNRLETLSEIMQDPRLARAVMSKSELAEKYLFMRATRTDLAKLKITRGIETSSDKLRTLRGILNLLTSDIHPRVIIWIDDAERIEMLSGRDMFEFQVFLRDLLEHVPRNLSILMNFTMTPGRKVEDMIQFLGEAVRYRLHKTIEVQQFTMDEFIDYVTDLLRLYRLPDSRVPDVLYPFKKEALEFVFRKTTEKSLTRTPRTINIFLSRVLEEAMFDENVSVIEKAFVEERADRIFVL